jgi:heat shock protein HslJ
MQCLQIRKDENEAWQYFYSQIHGFDFEPGYLYKLEVQEEKLDPSQLPQDVSSIKYTMVSVLEKTEDPYFSLLGTYTGTLPCADCEGIKTTLVLSEGDQYSRDSQYLGKQEDAYSQKGNFELNRETAVITLSLEDGETQQYQWEQDAIFHLDKQGNRIEGDLAELYKLTKKMTDKQLEDQKWILTHLMGQQVVRATGNTDASILFDSKEGRAGGSTSCNRYNCSYELLSSNRIKISPGMVSLMACENMEIEQQFNQMLSKVDAYQIEDATLVLTGEGNKSLATFRPAKEDE